VNRRQWMRVLGLAVGASLRPKSALVITGASQESESQNGAKPQPLPLAEYEPTSMLHAQDAFVERAAFLHAMNSRQAAATKLSNNSLALHNG
jgi:hypothetical protein